MSLVALSATYGAGGSQVGPAVAGLLGVEFVDRAITAAVASALDVPAAQAACHDDRSATGWLERFLGSFRAGGAYAPAPMPDEGPFAEDFQRATESALRERAATGSGVILGRAATICLRDDPRVLRVRLDGPRERRLRQAMALSGIDRASAERQMHQFDGAHAAYAMKFYRVKMSGPSHYHLVLDSTALALDVCAELIARAARSLAGEDGEGGRPAGGSVNMDG
ncbi:MAG: cytidylate kinase-like family protein [Acidobacteriota bacterium]|nr:cytidylate kinase-like family protein [Acidobacteriota bacterium]